MLRTSNFAIQKKAMCFELFNQLANKTIDDRQIIPEKFTTGEKIVRARLISRGFITNRLSKFKSARF